MFTAHAHTFNVDDHFHLEMIVNINVIIGSRRQNWKRRLDTIKCTQKVGGFPTYTSYITCKYRRKSLGGSFKELTVLKYIQIKILAQYPARPPFIKRVKLSETSAIYVALFGDTFLECELSHHCNGVAMILVIDLGRNNTPEVRFSLAGLVHVSRSGAHESVQRSLSIPMSCDNNVDIRHVQPLLRRRG